MEVNIKFNYQPNTTIHLYGVTEEGYIKADITHSYGFYLDGDKRKENVGHRSIEIKTKNVAYAKRKAIEYFRANF